MGHRLVAEVRAPDAAAGVAGDGDAGAFEAVIGLEIHVQLATATKMF
jgi:hypothetical protein